MFGDVILFIRFKISIFESILLLMLSVLVPLLSHFIGLIINLKYPKLDYENSTEVVKQSVSSLVSVLIGMILLIVNLVVLNKIIGVVSADIILLVATGIYCFIDINYRKNMYGTRITGTSNKNIIGRKTEAKHCNSFCSPTKSCYIFTIDKFKDPN